VKNRLEPLKHQDNILPSWEYIAALQKDNNKRLLTLCKKLMESQQQLMSSSAPLVLLDQALEKLSQQNSQPQLFELVVLQKLMGRALASLLVNRLLDKLSVYALEGRLGNNWV